jgi:hypothetical protein
LNFDEKITWYVVGEGLAPPVQNRNFDKQKMVTIWVIIAIYHFICNKYLTGGASPSPTVSVYIYGVGILLYMRRRHQNFAARQTFMARRAASRCKATHHLP